MEPARSHARSFSATDPFDPGFAPDPSEFAPAGLAPAEFDAIRTDQAEVGRTGQTVTCPACKHAVAPAQMTVDEYGDPICQTCRAERNDLFDLAPAENEVPKIAPPAPIPAPGWKTMKAPKAATPGKPAYKTGRLTLTGTKTKLVAGSHRGAGGQMVVGILFCLASAGATIGSRYATAAAGSHTFLVFYGLGVVGICTFLAGFFRLLSSR